MEQRTTQLESISIQLINRCEQLENTVNNLKNIIVKNEKSHKIESKKKATKQRCPNGTRRNKKTGECDPKK